MLIVRNAALAAMLVLVCASLSASSASAQSNGPSWAGATGTPGSVPPPPLILLPPPAPVPPPPVTPKLSGSFVYVYSFLDLREQLFGHDCLRRVNADLVDALKALGADSKVQFHKDIARAPPYDENYQPGYRGASSSRGQVPVVATISANWADEQATHPQYRLIILPSTFSTQGAWQFWTIRWTLQDIASGRIVWSTTTQGKRLIWLSLEEGGETRAKGIVDKFVADFHNSGIH